MITRAQSKFNRQKTFEVLQYFVPVDQKTEAEEHRNRLIKFLAKFKLDFGTIGEFAYYTNGDIVAAAAICRYIYLYSVINPQWHPREYSANIRDSVHSDSHTFDTCPHCRLPFGIWCDKRSFQN